jgi:polyhydroxybutyrate depolymerase
MRAAPAVLALALGLGLTVGVTACGGGGDDDPATPDADPTPDAGGPFAERPYELYVPPGYVAGTPTPLVVLLHGYSASAFIQEAYFQLEPVAEAETFLYARPEGTIDSNDNQFWNATNACCDFDQSNVDDVGYLTALIDDVARRYTVDPARVFVVGHSNGGFMSHRLACDIADRVAAIVSLAGVVWNDPALCTPSAPVSVAQVHGTDDETILYAGGTALARYPSAEETVAIWRDKNGCTGTGAPSTLDLETVLAGAETTITPATGCSAGVAVELWSIAGGSHVPSFANDWGERVWAFLSAHPKP